ncbi:MAG: hypothetical protein RIT43_1979 [Bacteroidota bacterium]|jgi:hypothetical protein
MTSKIIKALKLMIISNYLINRDFFSRKFILQHTGPIFQEVV